ncbi:MAG: DUF1206 domain-containing protein [Actinomycetota bacterium]|nr:DUF1206 domain-containing protein [Actinomycetota bacterium]
MDSTDVGQTAQRANDHPAIEYGARLGYAVNGLVHLLIAWLGIQLATGGRGRSADQSGALQTLAGTTVGRATLWVAVVGFALLGVWQVTEVFTTRKASERLKAAAKAVTYAVLAFSALGYAKGAGGSSSSQQTVDVTAKLMGQPMGRLLVAAVGLVVVGVGVFHVVKGWRKTFLADLESHPGELAEAFGRYGYVAKGVALGLVGVLFVVAAARSQPDQAKGLDGALHTVLQAPYGAVLLVVVSLGFAAYGLYSFFRARHADV